MCSPSGTTITGIQTLERAGFRSALIEAVDAAAKRSRETRTAISSRLCTDEGAVEGNSS